MKPIVVADDLLIRTEVVPGTGAFVGVAASTLTVTLASRVRVAGVLQARSRSVVRCLVELQSGWPADRPILDVDPTLTLWILDSALQVPAPGEDLPRLFGLAGGLSPGTRFVFPLVRVRWVLSTSDGTGLLSTDYVIVSTQIQPYTS